MSDFNYYKFWYKQNNQLDDGSFDIFGEVDDYFKEHKYIDCPNCGGHINLKYECNNCYFKFDKPYLLKLLIKRGYFIEDEEKASEIIAMVRN